MTTVLRGVLVFFAAGCCAFLSCSGQKVPDGHAVSSLSINVDVPVAGELGKLMLKLKSRNSHERFEAALELKRRGVEAGRQVILDGMKAAEWFIRMDAVVHAADFEDVTLGDGMAELLTDSNSAVAAEADRCLASLFCVYPEPKSKNRFLAWSGWLAQHKDTDRTELVREALVRVIGGVSEQAPENRLAALMILRGLRLTDKVEIVAARLADSSPAVQLAAIMLLDEVCTDSRCNDKVAQLLASEDAVVRGHAAVYLASHGAGEGLEWALQRAIIVPGLSVRAHELLVRIFGDGPVLKVLPGDMKPADLARLWNDWIVTDETLKRKRDWQQQSPTPTQRPTLKPGKQLTSPSSP